MPLCGVSDDLYSFKRDLSADGYAGKQLAMNGGGNAQVWHRRLGHLNTRSLELMNRKNVSVGSHLTILLRTVIVCAMGNSYQLVHSKKAKHATINAPFQRVYGGLMGTFKPTDHGGYKVVSKITDQFTG